MFPISNQILSLILQDRCGCSLSSLLAEPGFASRETSPPQWLHVRPRFIYVSQGAIQHASISFWCGYMLPSWPMQYEGDIISDLKKVNNEE